MTQVFGFNLNSSQARTLLTEILQVLLSTEHQTKKKMHGHSNKTHNSQTYFTFLCILLVISSSLIPDVFSTEKEGVIHSPYKAFLFGCLRRRICSLHQCQHHVLTILLN